MDGLRLSNNGLNFLDHICHMATFGADILGASKINVEALHSFVQRLVHQHQNQVWEHSQFQLLSSNIYFNSTRNLMAP
jgi:hypothetical protein